MTSSGVCREAEIVPLLQGGADREALKLKSWAPDVSHTNINRADSGRGRNGCFWGVDDEWGASRVVLVRLLLDARVLWTKYWHV